MRRSSLLRLAMTVALMGGLATAAKAQIVTNGGFELPPVAAGSYALYAAGGSFGGWSVGVLSPNDVLLHSGTYAEVANGMVFNAGAGAQSLDITGNGNTGPNTVVYQTLATVAGQTYDLTFLLGHAATTTTGPLGLLYPAGTAAAVRVQLVDVVSNVVLLDTTRTHGASTIGAINWASQFAQFTATGATTRLNFITTPPTGGPGVPNYSGLDSVVVTAVPEPGPLALCAAGLPLFLGLSWFRARRKAS